MPVSAASARRRSRPWPVRLRRLLVRGAKAAVEGGLLALAGTDDEAFRPRLERVDVPLAGLPAGLDGLTIAHLSDLHAQPDFPPERLRPALELAAAARPDLVALTGDYTNRYADPEGAYLAPCVAELRRLRAPLGVFAAFGNHDFPRQSHADPARRLWEAAGVVPLLDEVATVRRGGASLAVIGLRSAIARAPRPERVLADAPEDAVRLVLWHEPHRARETAATGAALQLSGHTHGGQIVLPGVGALTPHGRRRYRAGLYPVGGMRLYVTRGVGLLPPMVRLNCPPEVTLLTLRAVGA